MAFSFFQLHEASETVAEGDHSGQDIQKVFYDIIVGVQQPSVLLALVLSTIDHEAVFISVIYLIHTSDAELSAFVRHQAWLATHRYREAGSYREARQCLAIARAQGLSLNWGTVKQYVRLYALPAANNTSNTVA